MVCLNSKIFLCLLDIHCNTQCLVVSLNYQTRRGFVWFLTKSVQQDVWSRAFFFCSFTFNRQVKTEIVIGIKSLFVTVGLTVIYMAYLEPLTPFYNFFRTHEYNVWWFFASIAAYVFWFDTYFYWSHRWLHDFGKS